MPNITDRNALGMNEHYDYISDDETSLPTGRRHACINKRGPELAGSELAFHITQPAIVRMWSQRGWKGFPAEDVGGPTQGNQGLVNQSGEDESDGHRAMESVVVWSFFAMIKVR